MILLTANPVHNRKNKSARIAIVAAIAIAFIVVMFVPIIPVSYEEIMGGFGNSDEPVGRMVTKNISVFQIITGTD